MCLTRKHSDIHWECNKSVYWWNIRYDFKQNCDNPKTYIYEIIYDISHDAHSASINIFIIRNV